MNRRLATSRKGAERRLLSAVLGLMLLVASAISYHGQAAPPVSDPGAASNITHIAEAVLPKIEREDRARISLPTPDGDDVPPLPVPHPGLSFPVPAQASLPDPPVTAQQTPHLSTRFSAPRAPPVSA